MIIPALQRQRRVRHGMVLIEVVVALTLFAAISLSLVTALDSSFDAANDRGEVDTAIRGLNNQLALLHASRVLPGDRDLPDDGSGLLYHLSVSQEQMVDQKKAPVLNMFRVILTVSWKSNGELRDRSASELIYQP